MAEITITPRARAGGIRKVLERYPFLPALVIVMGLLLLNGVFSPNSLSYRSLTGLFSTYMALILLAIAQTYVVYAGDIDLSAGSILSLVNVAIVVLMERWGAGPAPCCSPLLLAFCSGSPAGS